MTAPRIGKRAVKAPKLTGWFLIGTHGQPTRAGWYEVKYAGDRGSSTRMKHFDGEMWRNFPGGWSCSFGNVAGLQGDKWRGLAADPSKAVGK